MNNKIKSTVKIAVLILLIVSIQSCFSQPPHGQGAPPPPDKDQVDDLVDMLDKDLNLTDEQVNQITKKYEDHFNEVEKMMEDGRPERTVMEKMKSDFEADVKSVLTDEQKKKYEKLLKRHNQGPGR
jgi:Spy/CpxP family protein refolding chaperone